MNKFKKKLTNLFSKSKRKSYKEIFKVSLRSLKDSFRLAPTFATFAVISTLLLYLIPIASTFVTGRIIDELSTALELSSWTAELYKLIAVFFILLLTSVIIGYARTYIDNMFALRYDKVLTLKLLNKFSTLDFSYYENSNYNDLFQKARENIRYSRFLFFRIIYLLSNTASLLTVITAFLIYKPILVLFIVLANIPGFVNELVFGETKWGIWKRDGKIYRNYEMTKTLLSDEKSLKELRIFRSRVYLVDTVKRLLDRFNKKQENVESKRFTYGSVLEVLSTFVFLASYIVITNDVVMGIITLGMFTFYVTTLNNLSRTFSNIFRYVATCYEAGLYVKDYYKVLDLPIKVESGDTRLTPVKNKPPVLTIENITFKYPGMKKPVFKDFNLTINSGEHVAIVGENGAGKTTLISLLQRFYDVQKGSINVNGLPLKKIDLEDWYRHLATLSQEYVKYHFTASKNISLGDLDKIANTKLIKDSAKLSGADKFIAKYEKGYNQVLSKRFPKGIDPSEGQWQKIALARAFFKDSPILILDEPTSAIDPKSEYEIFQKLFDFAKDKTVIIISHRFSTVRNADRIIVLDDGKIVEEGSHTELIKLDGMYKEAFELQKKGYDDV